MSTQNTANATARSFRNALSAGYVLIGASVALLLSFPAQMARLPPGFRTPVLAFQLARSESEIEAMFGPAGSSERATWLRAMDVGNSVDFAFMLAYATFLMLLARALRAGGYRAARVTEVLAVLAACADALENMRCFEITAALAQGDGYSSSLAGLALFTRLKWGAVALSLTLLIPRLLTLGWAGRATAALAGLTGLFTGLALTLRGVSAELMSLTVSLAFLGCVLVARQGARTRA